MKISTLFKHFLLWRLALIVVALLGSTLIHPRIGYIFSNKTSFVCSLLSHYANFDGIHYMSIAKYWYGNIFTYNLYAFFPLFPLIMQKFDLFGDLLMSSLFISHLFLFLAIIVLTKLLRLDLNEKQTRLTLFLIAIFPTAFFFGAVYTESLFLFLSVSSFYFSRRKNFPLACIFAMFASLTRLSGIFLWPALILEFISSNSDDLKKTIKNHLLPWLLLPPLGLLYYMDYQFKKTGDWLFFLHSQPGFGANRAVDKLILLHQVFFRYIKMIIYTQQKFDPLYVTVFLEFLIGVLFLVLILKIFQRLRPSYAWYSLLSYLIPTFTGTFSSLPRYVLVLFPAFMVLSQFLIKHQNIRRFYVTTSMLFLIICQILFANGYFVS